MILLFFGMSLNMGCCYLVKNEQHLVYSKAQYGSDKFVIVKDHHIHYVEIGPETEGSDTVLLIPGAFSTYRSWNRMIPFLSRHYKLLAIDYIGAGDSDKPRSGFSYSVEEQADLIAEMIEKLQISKANVVGVSYGGIIALNLATRYPGLFGKVVCIEGSVIKPEKLPNDLKKELLRWPVIGDFFISMIRSGLFDKATAKSVMGRAWQMMSDEERREIVEIISQNNKTASRVSWYRISRTFHNSKDFVEKIKTIQSPILYLYGGISEFRPMAEMNIEFFKTYLPKVEIVIFKDGIHDLELQKPREVANLILEFLNKSREIEEK